MKLEHVKLTLKALATTKTPITSMLWGRHGIGKSQIVAAAAKELNYTLITLILSQKEAVDVAGVLFTYESKELGMSVTASHPPDWFASALKKGNVVLFLDEFNMARREVMSAAFQLVLDRSLNNMSLPSTVLIVCAGNPDDERYDVTPMSESLQDRLMHIKVDPDTNAWLNWARTDGASRVHPDVAAFIATQPKAIRSEDKRDEKFPIEIKHSERSWERVSMVHKLPLPAMVKTECIRGIVGLEHSIAFMQKYGSSDLPLDALDILTLSPTVKDRITLWSNPKRMRIDLLNASVSNLVTFTKNNDATKYVLNVVEFIKLLPDDVANMAITQLFEMPGYSDAFMNDSVLKDKIKTISLATELTLKVA